MSSVRNTHQAGTQTPKLRQLELRRKNQRLGMVVATLTVAVAASVIFYRALFG